MAYRLLVDCGEDGVVVAGRADLAVHVAVQGGDTDLDDVLAGVLEGAEQVGVEGQPVIGDLGAGRRRGRCG
ncbi:hypothetical protein [Streptomyces sp. NPDC102409]|uniref:hypothetical protein n=1 Tax=Streptomyces sp. NPDC102409 TaxID=3366172 RepID=UPI0037F19CFB